MMTIAHYLQPNNLYSHLAADARCEPPVEMLHMMPGANGHIEMVVHEVGSP